MIAPDAQLQRLAGYGEERPAHFIESSAVAEEQMSAPTSTGDDLLLLTSFVLFSEHDRRRLQEANQHYLLATEPRVHTTLLRDKVLERWLKRQGPIPPGELYQLAIAVESRPAAALQLCYNVARAFSDGGAAIPWSKAQRSKGLYTTGLDWFTAPANPATAEPSLLSALFRSESVSNPSDLRCFFGSAWLTLAMPQVPAQAAQPDWYRGVLTTYRSFPATVPWSWANAIFFYEGVRWGRNSARIEQVHRAAFDGARFALILGEGGLVPTAHWYVPSAGGNGIKSSWTAEL